MLRPGLQDTSTRTDLVAELAHGVAFCFFQPDQKALHLRVELDPGLCEQVSDPEMCAKGVPLFTHGV